MPGPTLSAEELAEELGRSTSWLYDHWRRLHKEQRLPAPLLGGASPLTWSRAQVYAWLDRELSPAERLAAVAFRAAAAAADGARLAPADTLAIEAHRAELDFMFARPDTPSASRPGRAGTALAPGGRLPERQSPGAKEKAT